MLCNYVIKNCITHIYSQSRLEDKNLCIHYCWKLEIKGQESYKRVTYTLNLSPICHGMVQTSLFLIVEQMKVRFFLQKSNYLMKTLYNTHITEL